MPTRRDSGLLRGAGPAPRPFPPSDASDAGGMRRLCAAARSGAAAVAPSSEGSSWAARSSASWASFSRRRCVRACARARSNERPSDPPPISNQPGTDAPPSPRGAACAIILPQVSRALLNSERMKNLLGEGNESLEVNATEPKRHRRRQRPCALPHPSPYRRLLGMTWFACTASDARRLL